MPHVEEELLTLQEHLRFLERSGEDKQGNVEDIKDVIKCCNSKKDR
jgi:hypothetical protein